MSASQQVYLKWALVALAAFLIYTTTELRGSSLSNEPSRIITFTTYKDSYPLPGYPCAPNNCVTWYYGWHLRLAHYRFGFWYGALAPLLLLGLAGYLHLGATRKSRDGH